MIDSGLPRTSFRGFLFADLRGYSDYVEQHGDHAGVELLTGYRILVRSTVERYEGAEIRTEGDSFFVVFPSASRAVSCGMDIVARAAAATPPIRVGVGVHAGEAADTGEGPVGSAVNIAARVCSQAGAEELIVTEMVRALTRTLVPFRFVPRGTPILKGIGEPIPLFRVMEPGDAPATDPIDRGAARPMSMRRIALAASISTIAIVGLGLAAIIGSGLGAGPVPTPSHGAVPASPTASGSGAATSPAASSALTSEEQNLVARLAGLRPAERVACRSGTLNERANGATTDVTCPLATGAGATTVHYDLFDQTAVMLTAFDAYVRAHADPTGDCSASPVGGGAWSVPQIAQGHLLCFQQSGAATIIWTYEGGEGVGLMGSAVRDDGDWQQLYAWWAEVHPLIAH